jgi:hypothetical protein
MNNRAIELHDSTLDAISVLDGVAMLHFPCVYIHDSIGVPGVDSGSGWVQEAMLRIRDAVVVRSFSTFPVELLDGLLKLDEAILQNEIPIPLRHEGTVEFRLESSSGETLLITGRDADLELLGEPKYVEEFHP